MMFPPSSIFIPQIKLRFVFLTPIHIKEYIVVVQLCTQIKNRKLEQLSKILLFTIL
jgi:hypothetical protein